MTIKETQDRIDMRINEYGIRYFNELTSLAVLIDLSDALEKNIEKKTSSDATRHLKNEKLGKKISGELC